MTTPDRTLARRRLTIALVLVAGFFGVEAVAAFHSGSLALLSDAGHMLSDVAGLGMALAAMTVAAGTARKDRHTYGRYRLEMLAAAANSVLLIGVGGYAVIEGIRRLGEAPEVDSGVMLVVGAIGLAINLVAWLLLRRSAAESLNLEGASLEVLADLAGSIGAVGAAVLLRYGGWSDADAVFGIAIGLFVIPRAIRLGARALRVLMQHSPASIPLDRLEADLEALPGVVDSHDLHVWTLTSGMEVASVHLLVSDDADLHDCLDQATALLKSNYGIEHATVQIEPHAHDNCVEAGW